MYSHQLLGLSGMLGFHNARFTMLAKFSGGLLYLCSATNFKKATTLCSKQLGGLPGCSVEHYLVLMLDFIHRNIDKSHQEPTAVLAGLVDFRKAFNRIDHNVIITILSDLNIPTCSLRLVISCPAKMCVRYNGAESSEQDILGGGPQGGLLTVILFDLQVNLAGAPCPIPSLLSPCAAGPEPAPQQAGPLPLCHLKEKTLKKKYVDDLSFLERINLRLSLVPSAPIIGPPNTS